MIGDKFHPAAVAETSKIGALLGEVEEQIHALCDGVAIPAGVDDKIANLCLRSGSAQGTVERDVAGFLQDGFKADVVGDCDAGEGKLGSSCGIDIKADHAPFTIDKVTGDRASHDAKSDDSNGLVHESSFLSNSIDGQRRPRIISDQAMNNRQVASAGQAALVAMQQNEERRLASLHLSAVSQN